MANDRIVRRQTSPNTGDGINLAVTNTRTPYVGRKQFRNSNSMFHGVPADGVNFILIDLHYLVLVVPSANLSALDYEFRFYECHSFNL